MGFDMPLMRLEDLLREHARAEESTFQQVSVRLGDLRSVVALLQAEKKNVRDTYKKLEKVQLRAIQLLTEHGVREDCCAKAVTKVMHELLDLIAYYKGEDVTDLYG